MPRIPREIRAAKGKYTREDLGEDLWKKVGFTRAETDEIVRVLLGIMSDALVRGEIIDIPEFGKLTVKYPYMQKAGTKTGYDIWNKKKVVYEMPRRVVFEPYRKWFLETLNGDLGWKDYSSEQRKKLGGSIPMGATISHLKRYVELLRLKASAESEVDVHKEKLAQLEPKVLEYFERQGMDRLTIDGMTLYPRRELWAKKAEGASTDEIIERLEESGLSDFIKDSINWRGLTSHFREMDASGTEIPEGFKGLIECTEKFTVGFRKD